MTKAFVVSNRKALLVITHAYILAMISFQLHDVSILGHYLYLETSTTLPAGSKAIINTPYYFNNGQKCVQFYYHMYGNTVGQLNVYVKYSFFSNQLLFSKSGNQNDTWRLAQVQVTRRTYYRVR